MSPWIIGLIIVFLVTFIFVIAVSVYSVVQFTKVPTKQNLGAILSVPAYDELCFQGVFNMVNSQPTFASYNLISQTNYYNDNYSSYSTSGTYYPEYSSYELIVTPGANAANIDNFFVDDYSLYGTSFSTNLPTVMINPSTRTIINNNFKTYFGFKLLNPQQYDGLIVNVFMKVYPKT